MVQGGQNYKSYWQLNLGGEKIPLHGTGFKSMKDTRLKRSWREDETLLHVAGLESIASADVASVSVETAQDFEDIRSMGWLPMTQAGVKWSQSGLAMQVLRMCLACCSAGEGTCPSTQ